MKRKIIRALDKYEDLPVKASYVFGPTCKREEGITQDSFIAWFREQKGNEKYDYQKVDKCINDCKEDDYIKKEFVDGKSYWREYVEDINAFPLVMKKEKVTPKIENIYVGSKGRDLLKFYYFLPTVIGKMSMTQVVIFGITTGIVILLGYLGISGK